jgi:hypothetical protein
MIGFFVTIMPADVSAAGDRYCPLLGVVLASCAKDHYSVSQS